MQYILFWGGDNDNLDISSKMKKEIKLFTSCLAHGSGKYIDTKKISSLLFGD